MKTKTINDVRGNQIRCVNFSSCPICYGCRSYNSADILCEECAKNMKKNVCNTRLHRSDLISKLVKKDVIILED